MNVLAVTRQYGVTVHLLCPSVVPPCVLSYYSDSGLHESDLSGALVMQGSEVAIFVLAPMLLLLNQGPLLSGLKPQRRYTPLALAVSGYLSLTSVIQVQNSPSFLRP